MLPNFLIIGAQKAASSWLAHALSQHPDIFVYTRSEIRFFNRHYEKGLEWYEAHFNQWSGETAIGEKSPGYLTAPEVPERIFSTLGDVKLMASLRHPVDRAYSHFWHDLASGRLGADADFRSFYRRQAPWARSHYAAAIQRYVDRFPRENLLVLVFEEMMQNRNDTFRQCLRFLEVNPEFVPAGLNQKVNRGKNVSRFQRQLWTIRKGLDHLPAPVRQRLVRLGRAGQQWLPQDRRYRRLPNELRQELLPEYLPDIYRLEELLGRDLSVWYGSDVE